MTLLRVVSVVQLSYLLLVTSCLPFVRAPIRRSGVSLSLALVIVPAVSIASRDGC